MYYAIRSNPKSTLMLNCETYAVNEYKLDEIFDLLVQGETVVNLCGDIETPNWSRYNGLTLSRYYGGGAWRIVGYDSRYCVENNILPVYFETRVRLRKDYNYLSDKICFVTEGDFIHILYRGIYSKTFKTAIRALYVKGRRLYVAFVWEEEPCEFSMEHSVYWDYCTRNEFMRKVLYA